MLQTYLGKKNFPRVTPSELRTRGRRRSSSDHSGAAATSRRQQQRRAAAKKRSGLISMMKEYPRLRQIDSPLTRCGSGGSVAPKTTTRNPAELASPRTAEDDARLEKLLEGVDAINTMGESRALSPGASSPDSSPRAGQSPGPSPPHSPKGPAASLGEFALRVEKALHHASATSHHGGFYTERQCATCDRIVLGSRTKFSAVERCKVCTTAEFRIQRRGKPVSAMGRAEQERQMQFQAYREAVRGLPDLVKLTW